MRIETREMYASSGAEDGGEGDIMADAVWEVGEETETNREESEEDCKTVRKQEITRLIDVDISGLCGCDVGRS